jgi:hypothetical protein
MVPMRKETFLLLVGVAVFITPFLALPQAWIAIYQYVLGGCIVLVSISCRVHVRRRNRKHSKDTLHIENDSASDKDEQGN